MQPLVLRRSDIGFGRVIVDDRGFFLAFFLRRRFFLAFFLRRRWPRRADG